MDNRIKSKHDADCVFVVDPDGNLAAVPASFQMDHKARKGFRWATAGEVPADLAGPVPGPYFEESVSAEPAPGPSADDPPAQEPPPAE